MNIQDAIQKKLTEVEEQERVTILYAAESGSRSWGFASPDSDYDVRFVYVRRQNDYLRLEKTRDVIEYQLDDVFDVSGWDLQKALVLLNQSNPTLFEWAGSPVVYRTSPFWERIAGVLPDYFSVKKGLYHYLSMAKTNYRMYLKEDMVRIKKYFYVIRPILAAKWVAERRTQPPMPFAELCDAMLDAEIRPVVEELTARKMQTPELGLEPKIPALNAYIERGIDKLTVLAEQEQMQRNPGWEPLDRLFLDGIAFGENR